MKRYFCILQIVMVALMGYAQESQTEYNFLRLPVSAHEAALGGDNISLVEDDASLMFANPALLSTVSDRTIGLNYMNYMAGSNMLSASYNRVIRERASVALSVQGINYGTMKETDENNVQTGEFSAKDISVAGYFSYLMSDHWAGGISAKFITSYIGNYNSLAVGVDLGVNYYDEERGWSVSAVAKNLGGQLKAFNDDYEKMPIDLQMGVSKRLTNTPFRYPFTLVDLNHWNYKFINHAVFGVDIMMSQSIWVGGGYNFRRANEMTINSNDEESTHGAGFSLGAGINLERFRLNLAYGKYHVSSSSITVNLAYTL